MIATQETDMFNGYRSAAAAVAATALVLLAGCSGGDDKTATTAPPASPAPSAAASSAAAADPGAGPADIVKEADLRQFTATMPAPKGAPAGGIWSEPLPAGPGHEFVNYLDKGGKGYVSVRFQDCRDPQAQAKKDAYGWCSYKPIGKIKGYDLSVNDDPTSPVRILKVNHVTILVDVWVGFDETFKGKDVEAFIATLDLDTLSKM
jgi:hypothetical protein